MKKRAFLIVGSFLLCNFLIGPQRTSQARTSRDQSLKFPEFHDMANIEAFKDSVIRARRAFRNNPELFLQFLNTRTVDGITPLMYASIVSGDEIIEFLIDQAQLAFGKNKNLMIRFLNEQDDEGNTAFYLASDVGAPSTIKTLLSHSVQALQEDKNLFFKLITTPPYGSKWTPLHMLAYDSDNLSLRFLVELAQKIFGKNSDYYEQFINAQTEDGSTAYAYTLSPNDRYFLSNNGATVYQTVSKEDALALSKGDDLIDTVKTDNLEKFKKVLHDATLYYKSDPNHFIEMMSKRDESGWTALMHAAANNKIDFIEIFFDYVANFFKDSADKTALFDVLSNVATDGRTALILAISRRHFKAASLIIDKALEYTKNKVMYYAMINVPERNNGYTALISAAYNSSTEEEFYQLIEKLVNSVVSRFPQGSHTLFHFINAVDKSGNTALSYATDPRTRTLLMNHGAVDPHAYSAPRTHTV